jgi:hypothetical protein
MIHPAVTIASVEALQVLCLPMILPKHSEIREIHNLRETEISPCSAIVYTKMLILYVILDINHHPYVKADNVARYLIVHMKDANGHELLTS